MKKLLVRLKLIQFISQTCVLTLMITASIYGSATSNNEQTYKGGAAFIKAISKGDIKEVEKLIRDKVDLNSKNKFGDTALMIAAEEGYVEIVKMLIEAGANLNQLSDFNETALMMAVREAHVEIVKMLIEAGADINKQGKTGDVALILAAKKNGYVEMVRMLIKAGADLNRQVALRGIGPGADLNHQAALGDTALMSAARWGNEEAVKELIVFGADLYKKNCNNKTALVLATNDSIKNMIKKAIKFYEENTKKVSSLKNIALDFIERQKVDPKGYDKKFPLLFKRAQTQELPCLEKRSNK